MRKKLVLLALAFSSLFISNNGYGQQKDYAAQIDSLIQTTHPRSFNGVISITQHGKTKYKKAFGYSDREKKIALTSKDNFIIMSNSKQITAVLLLKEVEKGKIDLQSPVRTYLPDLNQHWADTVTVHQLLNFSAGITAIDKPLVFAPGTDFIYGNATYIMLGKIIEKVTGRKYSDVANDLFKELNMKDTYCYNSEKQQNRVQGYRDLGSSFQLVENPVESNEMVPAAGIISNVKDLNTWDEKLHKGKVLKTETYRLMTNYTITAQHNAFGKEKIGYGYGVRISDKTPIKFIGHTGGGSGFVSFKVYFPESDIDLVVLENTSNENMDLFYDTEIKIKEIIMNSSLMKD